MRHLHYRLGRGCLIALYVVIIWTQSEIICCHLIRRSAILALLHLAYQILVWYIWIYWIRIKIRLICYQLLALLHR